VKMFHLDKLPVVWEGIWKATNYLDKHRLAAAILAAVGTVLYNYFISDTKQNNNGSDK
jgi:hypothetical protein